MWHKRVHLPSATAKLARHVFEGEVFPDETLPWQAGPKMTWFRETSALRLQLPTPPDGPGSEGPPVRGNDAPCVCGCFKNHAVPVRCTIMWSTIAMHGTHQGGVDSQLAPPKEGQSVHHRRRLSLARTGRSRSRIKQLVPTKPPASLQMRAAALSSANPLLPKTPALAHVARWWPNESIGRPHLQVCEDRGNG